MPDNFGAQSRFDFDSRPQSHTDDLIVSVVLAADHIGAVGAVILAGFERQLLRPEQDVDGLTGGFCLRVGEHHEAQLGLGAAADSFTWEDVGVADEGADEARLRGGSRCRRARRSARFCHCA